MAVFVDEDIARFDVAVDHSGLFRGLKSEGYLVGDGEDLFFRERPAPGHGPFEALAFEEFHDEIKSSVGAADGVDFDDVGVVHLGGEPGFIFEGQDAVFVVAVFLVEDLDGDLAVEDGIPANEDDAHPADGIAAGEFISTEFAFDAGFCFAVRADCGLEGSEGGDVQKLSATLARFVGGRGFRRLGHKIRERKWLTSFQKAAEHSSPFALAGSIPGNR